MQSISAATQVEGSTPESEGLARDLYALVVYLHKHCNADLFEAITQLELSLSQIKLLHHLEQIEEPITLKDAAEFLRVSLPAASRLVDDLVRRDYADRVEDAEDRRMKRLSPTEAGHAVVRRLNAARLHDLSVFTASLDDEERAAVQHALATLLKRNAVSNCRPEDVPA